MKDRVVRALAGGLRSRELSPKLLALLAQLVPYMWPPVQEPWTFRINTDGPVPVYEVNGRRIDYKVLARKAFAPRVEASRTTAMWLRKRRQEMDELLVSSGVAPEVIMPILREIELVHQDGDGLKDLREAYLLGLANGKLMGGKL